jgi:hypothetical protein
MLLSPRTQSDHPKDLEWIFPAINVCFLLRRGRWSAVIVVMMFDSTGNGNTSEISEVVNKKIKTPAKFINYDVDRRMASFRSQGGNAAEMAYVQLWYSEAKKKRACCKAGLNKNVLPT